MSATIEATGLRFAYGDLSVLDGVDLSVEPGELVGLVGPNGAGKTTLLHVLLGLLEGDGGNVRLGGEPLSSLPRDAIARRAALVPQGARADFAFTVRELVAMGRTPYLGRFRPEGPDDVKAVETALDSTETRALEGRLLSELSGGERQRVHIARAIAQQTRVLLLDEPTANLDVEHQLQIMDLVSRLTREGKSAIAAIHDLTLAARYCDRVLVLADHRIVASGSPDEVITKENLARFFHIEARVERDESDGFLVVVPLAPARYSVDVGEGAH